MTRYIESIRDAFRQGDRASAWDQALSLLPASDPLRRQAKRFLKFAKSYEAQREAILAREAISTLSPSYTRLESPPLPLRFGFERRKRGSPPRGVRPRFIQRWKARLSWADPRWQDPEQRRSRMLPCHLAARKPKNDRILAATHPHIRRVLGDKEVLRRAGR